MIDSGVEKSYSTFEKILYIIVIPIFFTIILSLALFAMFDYNVKDTLLKVGREIPLVGQYLPKPSDEATAAKEKKVDTFGIDYTEEIKGLNDKIAIRDDELKKATNDIKSKDQVIKELKASLAQTQEQLKAKSLSDDEYTKRIKGLADVYGNMTPGKAAPIMENLTNEEAILVLEQMSELQKRNILQKMNPERAAEISILSKDVTPLQNQQLNALRSRLNLQDPNAEAKSKVSKPDLAETYSTMDPKVAAEILTQLYNINVARVYAILANMDTAARAPIVEQMEPKLAATISDKLSE